MTFLAIRFSYDCVIFEYTRNLEDHPFFRQTGVRDTRAGAKALWLGSLWPARLKPCA